MVGKEIEGLGEQLQKIGPQGKAAAAGTQAFSSALEGMFRVVGFGYAGGRFVDFLTKLGLASKDMKRLGPITFESTQQLHRFTRGLGVAVGGMDQFLREIDKLERKQSDLNRAFGIGAISISNYYEQLVTATGMGGKAARTAAEDIIKTLREQRIGTEQEINEMVPLFIKYSLGISRSFPRDVVYMHEQLGMTMNETADAYETIAFNAAAARIPLDLYKNSIFSLTVELRQYGFSTRDAMSLMNLFTDDIKKGTLTMREAQSAARTLAQAQFTAGGLGFRVKMGMFLRRAAEAGALPENLQRNLETATQREYGDRAKFMDINALQLAFVVHKLSPETFARSFKIAGEESMRGISKEAQMPIFAKFWPGFEQMFFEKRLKGALGGGGDIFAKSVEDAAAGAESVSDKTIIALNALRKQIEQNTKDMREWYYPLSQFMDWLRAQGLGAVGGVAGGIAGATPGILMSLLALRGIGFGVGGAAAGAGMLGLGTSVKVAASAFAGLIGPLAAFTFALGGIAALGLTAKAAWEWWSTRKEEEEKREMEQRTPAGRVLGMTSLARSIEFQKMGLLDKAEVALTEARGLGITTVGGAQAETALRFYHGRYAKGEIAAGRKPISLGAITTMAEEDIRIHAGRAEYIIEIRHKPQFIRIPRSAPPGPADLLPGLGAQQQ